MSGQEPGGQEPGRQEPSRQELGRQEPGRQEPGRPVPGRPAPAPDSPGRVRVFGTQFAGALLMAALLVLYIVLVGQRAVAFISTGLPIGIGIGVALFVVAVIGAVLLVFELRFGFRITRLARRLEDEGGTPTDQVPLRPSGRVERSAADALFPKYRDAVQAAPEDWRAWFRLGVVYDAAGDRKRARDAMRTALRHAR